MDLIKDLRARSGAPIVDCQKALKHSNGDIDGAVDWLREHGAAKASLKVQGRETVEGLIGINISPDGKVAAMVKVASETDFAGRSAMFVKLVKDVAEQATNQQIRDDDEGGDLDLDNFSTIVKPLMDEAIVAIRENLSVAAATKLQTNSDEKEDGHEQGNSILVGYVHNRVDHTIEAGSAAAIVEIASPTLNVEQLQIIGKKLAMHVVAARPAYLSPKDVPDDVIEKEKDILSKQIAETGKPADVVDKIIMGRMRKFFEAVCLTEQAHMIEDSNPKVEKVLKDQGVVVKRFVSMAISY